MDRKVTNNYIFIDCDDFDASGNYRPAKGLPANCSQLAADTALASFFVHEETHSEQAYDSTDPDAECERIRKELEGYDKQLEFIDKAIAWFLKYFLMEKDDKTHQEILSWREYVDGLRKLEKAKFDAKNC